MQVSAYALQHSRWRLELPCKQAVQPPHGHHAVRKPALDPVGRVRRRYSEATCRERAGAQPAPAIQLCIPAQQASYWSHARDPLQKHRARSFTDSWPTETMKDDHILAAVSNHCLRTLSTTLPERARLPRVTSLSSPLHRPPHSALRKGA